MTIDELMQTPRQNSICREEFLHITDFLGNKNFLVFGTGYDTEYWRTVNKDGFTLFLEDKRSWVLKDATDIHLVKYTCKMNQFDGMMEEYRNGNYDRFIIQFPKIVETTKWDVILVDGPTGWPNGDNPGRAQSIFLSMMVSNKDTDVFIHDAERKIEDICSREMFSTIVEDLVFPPKPGYDRKLRRVRI
jgi:uncharacterized protein (TIGR01627 family)